MTKVGIAYHFVLEALETDWEDFPHPYSTFYGKFRCPEHLNSADTQVERL